MHWPVSKLEAENSRLRRELVNAKLVRAALRSAYWQRKPAAGLLVTDREIQYASREYCCLAADFGVVILVSRKGNALRQRGHEEFLQNTEGPAI